MHTIHTLYTDADRSTDALRFPNLRTSAMAMEPRARLYAVQTPSGDDQATQTPDEPGTVTITHTPVPHPTRRPRLRATRRRVSLSSLVGRAIVAPVVVGALALLWRYLSQNKLLEAGLLVGVVVFAFIGLSWAGWA